MRYDYAVVGAGVSGMSAALTLARTGARVLLVEKAATTAPLIRGFVRQGVRFDTGFHCAGGLEPGGALDVLLRYLGVAGRIATQPLHPDGFDVIRCREPRRDFAFPYGWERVEARLAEAFPAQIEAVRRYLADVRGLYDTFPYVSDRTRLDPADLAASTLAPSLAEYLDGLTPDPDLRALLSVHAYLHGVAADAVPMLWHARVVASYMASVHTVTGGGGGLAAAFDAALAESGVEVVCGTGVEAVELSAAGTVAGLRLAGGERLGCGACVATLHPRLLLGLLPDTVLRPAVRQRVLGLAETPGAFVLYAVCDAVPAPLRGANLVVLRSPGDAGCRPDQTVETCPLYVTAAAAADGGTVPGGFCAVCPVSVRDEEPAGVAAGGGGAERYRVWKQSIERRILARLRADCPELVGAIRAVDMATPATFRRYVHTPFGSLYGAQHRVGDFPMGPRTRIEGLYLAGQSAVAPGVLGAAVSGFLACGQIAGHAHLQKELASCR